MVRGPPRSKLTDTLFPDTTLCRSRRCGRCRYCSAQPAPAGTGRGAVMDEYLLARGLHIVSALVLFGPGLGAAYQLYAACRSGDVAGIARVARQTVQAAWIFTTPAAVAQPINGLWLRGLSGYSSDERIGGKECVSTVKYRWWP